MLLLVPLIAFIGIACIVNICVIGFIAGANSTPAQ